MLSELPIDLLLFILATFVGALVTGIAGFAFGLIASAIWLHAITPAQSAALIAAFAIVIQGATLWKVRHVVQFSRLVPFLVGGALGVPLGAYVLRWASPSHMRMFVGVALILFSLYSLVRPKLRSVQSGTIGEGLCWCCQRFSRRQHRLGGDPCDHLGHAARLVQG
jgi:uncharacterized protein